MTLRSAKLSYEDLYPYQHLMIDHIRARDSSALWVDMGLGKTVATLTAIKGMIEDYDAHRVLVVAPLRVARKTWTDEIEAWSHLNGLTASKIIGTTPAARMKGLKQDADIHLINRENLDWLANVFMEHRKGHWYWRYKCPWDTMVLDESSSFKNQDTNRFRAARRFRKKIRTLIELTGTPAPNGLIDLWGQAFLMDRGQRLGAGIGDFRKRWFDPPDYGSYKYQLKPHADAEIHKLMGDIALTLKAEDYLDLEPVTNNFLRVEMTAKQKHKYEKFKRIAVLELAGKRITAVNAGVLWGKLLQLANGAVYTDHPAWAAFHEEKVERLMELNEDVPGAMMVIYNYKSDLARIMDRFERENKRKGGKRFTYRLLKTEQDEEDWNNGKIDRLILHPASAGHGLNLHPSGAEEIVWFGLTPNLEHYDQANARLAGGHRRVGRHITIHHIVCDETIDDDVVVSLASKGDVQEALMQATKRYVAEAA